MAVQCATLDTIDLERDMAGIPLLEKAGDEPKVPETAVYLPEWLRRTNLSQRLLMVIVLVLALNGFFDGTRRLVEFGSSMLASRHLPCWCGTSGQEAVSLGCVYDHIAVDWLPLDCTDAELVKEFDVAGPDEDGSWPYYESDPSKPFRRVNGSKIDSYALAGRDYWATIEWHVAHCLFSWRKQVRKEFRRGSIEPWNMKESHVEHCSDYILEALREQRLLWEADTWIPGRDVM